MKASPSRTGDCSSAFAGPWTTGRPISWRSTRMDCSAAKTRSPTRVSVNVGKGRAIRDLLAVSDGVLVLAGPDDDEKNASVGWIVSRWDGQETSDPDGQIKALATLDLSNVKLRSCDHEPRPEALAHNRRQTRRTLPGAHFLRRHVRRRPASFHDSALRLRPAPTLLRSGSRSRSPRPLRPWSRRNRAGSRCGRHCGGPSCGQARQGSPPIMPGLGTSRKPLRIAACIGLRKRIAPQRAVARAPLALAAGAAADVEILQHHRKAALQHFGVGEARIGHVRRGPRSRRRSRGPRARRSRWSRNIDRWRRRR